MAGHKFGMSTITNRENTELSARIMQIGEAADLLTLRVFTLAFAVREIDSIKLKDIEIEGEFETDTDHNIAIIDNMQVGLVTRLYVKYDELVKESDAIVYGEAIKN